MSEPRLRLRDVALPGRADRDALAADLARFLGPHGDPPEEMDEALERAARDGFVFELVDEAGGRAGAVVITETPFRKFQPRFHLAYIAVAPDRRGAGCGRILLEEARRRTGDDLALHVSPANAAALAFYERMGWKTRYVRMMPG